MLGGTWQGECDEGSRPIGAESDGPARDAETEIEHGGLANPAVDAAAVEDGDVGDASPETLVAEAAGDVRAEGSGFRSCSS
jgi:hypothetical protein